ncbi:hypothetical protein [Citricoccus sp. GCM10030269]|uniref:hypothetical protein n=1 Tax=Citricoccus sp. GCM10030269 TaxID=3273388 RepID=UPI0036236AAF
MNRQHARTRRGTLSAVLGTGLLTGLLTLSLAGCGGSENDPDGSSGSPETTAQTATPPATPATTPASSESASGSPSASDSNDTGRVKDALREVLGDQTQIVTGAQLEELQRSSQGLSDSVTITPEECGPEGRFAASGELPEGTELTGGVVVDTTETSAASDLLSVALYPDAAAAGEAIAGYEEYADACPSYSVEMAEGIEADATMEVADVQADGDAVLGLTINTTVSVDGGSLPPGQGDSTSTTVYVQDGERLITCAGTAAGGETKTTDDGVELINALRTELDG